MIDPNDMTLGVGNEEEEDAEKKKRRGERSNGFIYRSSELQGVE